MSSGPRQDPPARRSTSRAAVDALVASITLLVGAAMMVDSYGIGAGWADGSLQPGYFPFRIGAIICILSVAIGWLGFYFGSALFIAAFMRLGQKRGWIGTAAVSLGVMAALFILFEIVFLVPLPKGPIEALIGY